MKVDWLPNIMFEIIAKHSVTYFENFGVACPKTWSIGSDFQGDFPLIFDASPFVVI